MLSIAKHMSFSSSFFLFPSPDWLSDWLTKLFPYLLAFCLSTRREIANCITESELVAGIRPSFGRPLTLTFFASITTTKV